MDKYNLITNEDKTLESCAPVFKILGAYADEKVEQYRMDLIEDLTQKCEEAGLEMEMDFPRFTVLKGITGEKVLKSIGPQDFIDALGEVYLELLEKEDLPAGRPIPMQQFYLAYVIFLQSKTFFQNMDKGNFKGYSLDQFSV